MTRKTSTVRDEISIFMISRSEVLRMRNVSDKSCRRQNTHCRFSNFLPENRVVYVIMWKNVVDPHRPQMTIWRMHFACWIPKATNSHSEYDILLFHCKRGYTKEPQCYLVRILRVLRANNAIKESCFFSTIISCFTKS